MSFDPTLHARLIARQSDAELELKYERSKGRHDNQFWSQEWLDLAHRRAERLYDELRWADKAPPEAKFDNSTDMLNWLNADGT